MNLIQDEKQFNNFVDNILPDLKNDEVYFISLSARNKYLTDEERDTYALGRTEMFSRQIAKSKEQLKEYTMKKLGMSLLYKTTKNGLQIPEKALVVYININPSSMLKAYQLFQEKMNKEMNTIINALRNNKEPNYDRTLIQKRLLMNCVQKSSGEKHYIDIDCDTKKPEVVESLTASLSNSKIEFHVIETQGGFHFLIKKDTIPTNKKLKHLNIQKFNLMRIIQAARDVDGEGNEIAINGNVMVPVPGSCQANFLVRMV